MISFGYSRAPRGRARRDALAGRATGVYLCFVLLGLPLVVNDGYYDITETKHLYFLAVSAVYLAVQLFCLLPRLARRSRRVGDAGMGDLERAEAAKIETGAGDAGAMEPCGAEVGCGGGGAAAEAAGTMESLSTETAQGATGAADLAGAEAGSGGGGAAAEAAGTMESLSTETAQGAAGAADLAGAEAAAGRPRGATGAANLAGAEASSGGGGAARGAAAEAAGGCRRSSLPGRPAFRARLSAADCCMLAFVLLFALSGALSGRFGESLLGQYNRYQGLVTALVYAAVYFAVSRRFQFIYAGFLALVTGFAIVCAIAMLNDFSIDPLQIRVGLSRPDRVRYISTVGNLDFYGSVLAVLFPAVLAWFCHAKTPVQSVPAGVALLLGAYGMLLSGSESFVLAFIATLLLFPLSLLGQPRLLRRFLATVAALLAAMQLAHFLHACFGGELYVSYFMRVLLRPAVSAAIALLCLCAFVFAGRIKHAKAARRAYALALSTLLLAGAAFLVLANTSLADRSFGALDRFVKWNADWGTERGKIWAYCIDAYRSFPPLAKLFGGGPGCLYRYDLPHPLFSDAVLDTAHNEYLQYLLTIGAAGLTAYLGLLLSAALPVLRRAARDPLALGCLVGVAAYAAQAAVNIAQPFSTPFLFVFLGILSALRRPALTSSI